MRIIAEDNPRPGRRWPLHPQPRDWEGLESWVRRIAAAYGVSYDAFLKHALGRTGRGARDLDRISDAELARLSAGTGVSVERMREMNCASMWARANELRDGPLTDKRSEALDELRVAMSRAARRRPAYETADAGRLARQNWHVYRA
ncbi:MAG: TniQ family protein [Solirubrobacteraceae bacterium]